MLRNTDWELIRHCPCPLLLVKSSRTCVQPPRVERDAATRLARVNRALDQLAHKAGIAPPHRHLRTGDVASQLRAVAKKIGASIVVMGAVSRSAIDRAFIGGTAERVLDELVCDALVVKPHGLRTVVRRHELAGTRSGRATGIVFAVRSPIVSPLTQPLQRRRST